jgi:arylsulfatase A-like enzyme
MNRGWHQLYCVLLAFAMVTALTACRCGAPPPRTTTAPNVVLIVVDTLRQDRLGVYGHSRNTSPHLDKLAAESVIYERAYSQAPWTSPSIGSLLTGRYPSQLGIHKDRTALSNKERLLSELLATAGYRSGAAISHSYCGSAWQFHQGFESFDESNVLGHDAITSKGVTNRAIEFVDSTSPDTPYFLFAHYFDPHFAYIDHEEYAFEKDSTYSGPIKSNMKVQALRKRSRRLEDQDLTELFRLYDSEIAYTDEHIGRLVNHLRNRGDLSNTVLVFTADHGEEFLDHGRWGHTTRLYDELIRVPLIIHYPDGYTARVKTPVSLMDVVPTILAAVNQPTPKRLEGHDLRLPISSDRVIFSETSKGAQLSAAIQGDHKLILDHTGGDLELYDLGSDSGETKNIALKKPQLAKSLSAEIQRWSEQNRKTKKSGIKVELSDEEVQQLEALGYVDP